MNINFQLCFNDFLFATDFISNRNNISLKYFYIQKNEIAIYGTLESFSLRKTACTLNSYP